MFSNLKNILEKKDYQKFRLIFFLNLLLSVFEFITVISIPIFISVLIDPSIFINSIERFEFLNFFLNLKKIELIKYLTIFIILTFLLKNISLFLFILREQNHIKHIRINVLGKLFNYYLNAPYLIHLKKTPEVFTRTISNEIENLDLYMSSICNFFREFIALAVIFLILFWTAPVITIVTLLFFALIAIIYNYKVKPIINTRSQSDLLYQKKLFQIVNETFFGIRDLKVMLKEKEIFNLFNLNQKYIANNIFVYRIIQRLPKIFFEIFAVIFVLIITLVFLGLNQSYINILPKISLFAVCAFRFIPALNSLITSKTYIRISKPYLNSIEREMTNEKNFKLKNEIELSKPNIIQTFKNDKIISLKNINFSYPDTTTSSLKDITFDVEQSSTLGITGATGAGKSTLFYILLGLIKPSSGLVLNYEKNIFDNLENWKKKIGYISQSIFLMDESIKKNITFEYNDDNIDNEKLEKAVHFSELTKKIKELKEGINTLVGTNGIRLSGGERQRIAIARAIYRDPEIFFMDEATSALDDKTEQKIIDNFKKNFKSKTNIIIAHRQSSLDRCDQIKTLENGVIV